MTSQRNHPISDLVTALDHEINAILADNTESGGTISLSGGRLVATHDSTRDYAFSVKKWPSTPEEQYLIRPSRSQREWSRARASQMPDGKILVTTEADLGQTVPHAQLRKDDTVNSERLAKRITEVGENSGATRFNRTAAGWVLGEGVPKIGRCSEAGRYISGYDTLRLNDRQRLAVEHALASDVTFIWGPPGTGKTDVVARIVEGCYQQGLRTLFVAPTKVAVDQALERLCELLEHEDRFSHGLVQRSGEISIASLERRFGNAISADAITLKLTAESTEKLNRISTRLDSIRSNIELHQQVSASTAERRDLTEQDEVLTRTIAECDRDIAEDEHWASEAWAKLRRIDPTSGLFTAWKQDRIQDLRLEAQRYSAVADEARIRRQTAVREQHRCREVLDELIDRLSAALEKVSSIPTLSALESEEKILREAQEQLEREMRNVAAMVRRECRIMGATVSKAVLSDSLMESIDVVVIEEAGMVNLPSAWYAAGLAGKRVVLGGDFRQLPPVTHGSSNRKASKDDQQHSRQWMDRDVFHAAGLVDSAGRAQPDSRMICLDTQFRMRSGICDLVNTVAYPDSPLKTGRDDLAQLPKSPVLPGSLVLVDTASRRVPHGRGRTGSHKSSPVHEAVIHELIRGLQYAKVLPSRKAPVLEGKRPTDQLAVIAPYNDQVNSLSRSLHYRFGETYDGLVNTVHRFQGSQRPVVVVDTVAGAGDKLGFFYEGVGLSSDTCRLLNVALSRAQDHLVVVADVDFLTKHLSPGSEAARMVEHLVCHAQHLSVDDLVPVRAAADLAGLSDEELARPAFFPADEVRRAVEWDIGHARQSFEIYCAFLDPEPVRYWLKRLRPAIARGVRVVVNTREHDDESREAGLVTTLRDAGCEVQLRERMHEKVVIIDDAVLWHGSLNLMARSGPTDLMMRITDETACARVRRIMETARRDRPLAARRFQQGAPGRTDIAAGDVIDGRLYLKATREEKDDLKQVARDHQDTARWISALKLWHVDAKIPRERVARWLPHSDQP